MHSSQSGLVPPLYVTRLFLNFSLLGLSSGWTGLWGTMSLILRPSWKITLPAVDFFFLAAGWTAISVSSCLVVDSMTFIRVLFSGNNEDSSWGCCSSTAAAVDAVPETATSREAAVRVRVLVQAFSCPSCPVFLGCWICLVFPIEQQNIQLFQEIPIFLLLSLGFFSIEDLPTIPFKKFQYIFYLDILKFNSTFQKNKTFSSFKKFLSFFHCYCVFFFNRRFANNSVEEIRIHFLSRYIEIQLDLSEEQKVELFQEIPIFLPLSLRFFSRSKNYKQFRSRNSNTIHIPISLNLTYSFPPVQLFSA